MYCQHYSSKERNVCDRCVKQLADKLAVAEVRLEWLIDTMRYATNPRFTRDNFITPVTNEAVKKAIDAARSTP